MTTFSLADLFEAVVDAVSEADPDREALVCVGTGRGARRLTFAGLDDRANRAAAMYAELGVGPGDHVGLGLYNGHEFVESLLGLFKLGAVPVNVNYRYGADELGYLFADADLRVVLVEPDLVGVAESLADELPLLDHVFAPGPDYEAALAAASAARPAGVPRSDDDLYVLYTGGTTGMPKGVMWRHQDIFYASLGGVGTRRFGIERLDDPDRIGEWAVASSPLARRLPLCPLMHGGAQWMTLQALLNGATAVLDTSRHYDPSWALRVLADERVNMAFVIGDAVVRPLIEAYAADPDAYDLRELLALGSGGAILSPAVKDRITELWPEVRVADTFGASESGGQGRLVSGGEAGAPPRLRTDTDSAVFDEELRPIEPGSGRIGRLARRGWIPLGYYKDEEKTAETFPVIDGVRWSVPGDLAEVLDDGTILLLGRGAMSINTGGEKVFPEEVEKVVKAHPAIFDAVVVGVPDERFGERVMAVVSVRPDHEPSDDDLDRHCHERISGYKVPRGWVRVSDVQRLPTGKPDYRWARQQASPSD